MDNQERKHPEKAPEMKDLPPKTIAKKDEETVKGGAEPVGKPKPAEPVGRL